MMKIFTIVILVSVSVTCQETFEAVNTENDELPDTTEFLETSTLNPSKVTELSCTYKTNTRWWAVQYSYFCEQNQDVDIDEPDTQVVAVNGQHGYGRENTDVQGFRVDSHRMRYFPKGIENFFPNLEFIAIWTSELKEIHASDLAPFNKLRVLSIWRNDIEVLEKDLLKFNNRIEYIGFGLNKIKSVDPTVFATLNRLHTLHFDGNACYSRQVAGNRAEVLEMIEEIYEKCPV